MGDAQLEVGKAGGAGRAIDDEEIDLVEYLAVIWRYRWSIFGFCLVVVALTVVLTLIQPRQYRSTTTIVPPLEILQKQSSVGGSLGGLGGSMLKDVINTGSISGIYMEILKSRQVADTLIERFHLMEVNDKVITRSQARERLQRSSKVESTDDGAVKVTVTDTDPNRCAAVANAYVEELDRQNKRLSAGEATSKRVFLENRLTEVETRLSQIDNILTREAKVQEMLYEMLVQQYEIAKIEEAKSMPTIQVLDEAVVPELPVGRGTIKKAIMAAVAAFMAGVFWAFAREYVAAARQRRQSTVSTGRYDIQLPDDNTAPSQSQAACRDLTSAGDIPQSGT